MTIYSYTSVNGIKLAGASIANEKYKSYINLSGGISLHGKESYNIYYTRYASFPSSIHIIRQVKNYSALERV